MARRVGSQAGAGVDESAGAQPAELVFQRVGGGDDQVVDLVDRLGAGLDRRSAGDAQRPDCFHWPVAGFGSGGGVAAEGVPCRGFGVGHIGLAAAPARLAVGAVHLHHGDARRGEVAGQAGAVAAGDLDADPREPAPGRQPGEQFAIADPRCGERRRAEQPPRRIDCGGDVVVAVGVYPADDINVVL